MASSAAHPLFNTDRIDHLYQGPHKAGRRFFLHYGDLSDAANLISIRQEVRPDEVCNFAAQSHVQVSFESPEHTAPMWMRWERCACWKPFACWDWNRAPASIRRPHPGCSATCRKFPRRPPFYSRSPYACARLYAYWIMVSYREAYGMYACNGILFNHESPVRGETLVTRKIPVRRPVF